MRLWRYSKTQPEGKYLVVRRDGSTVLWPHFVMGARDPAVPAALLAYANEAEKLGYDPAFVADIRTLSAEFIRYRETHGAGDADAPAHRKDDPAIIEKMKLAMGS